MARVSVRAMQTVGPDGQDGAMIPFEKTESWTLISPAVRTWVMRYIYPTLIVPGMLIGGGGTAWWMSPGNQVKPAVQIQQVQPYQPVQVPAVQQPAQVQTPTAQSPLVIQPIVVQPVVIQPQPITPSRVQVETDVNVKMPVQPAVPERPQSIWSLPANR